jgi:hypothetical protein
MGARLSKSTNQPTMFTIQRYRGCAAGWQAIGPAKTAQDAKRLLQWVQRCFPEALFRLART